MEKQSKLLTIAIRRAEIFNKYEVAKVFWDTLYVRFDYVRAAAFSSRYRVLRSNR